MKHMDRIEGRPLRLKVARTLSDLEQAEVSLVVYGNDRGGTISDWETGKTRNIPDTPLMKACKLYEKRGGVSGLWIREAVPPVLDANVQVLEDEALGGE